MGVIRVESMLIIGWSPPSEGGGGQNVFGTLLFCPVSSSS